jgi:hypothetical protein
MPYIINKYSGSELVVLQDGTLDTSTSIGLLGRNYVGYGEVQNENFLFLLVFLIFLILNLLTLYFYPK